MYTVAMTTLESEIFKQIFDYAISTAPKFDKILCLELPLEVAAKRNYIRGREEDGNLGMKYQRILMEEYDLFFRKMNNDVRSRAKIIESLELMDNDALLHQIIAWALRDEQHVEL